MLIHLSDLTAVNDAAKAIKSRYILWYNNLVIGIDQDNKFILTHLDPSQVSSFPQIPIQMESRELSAFLKSVILSEFEIPDVHCRHRVAIDSGTATMLSIGLDPMYGEMLTSILNGVNYYESRGYYEEEDVTETFSELYGLKKDTGSSLFTYKDHPMYLFSGIAPLNKGDRLFISLIDLSPNTFNVRFRIEKKSKHVVFIYLNFLNIM